LEGRGWERDLRLYFYGEDKGEGLGSREWGRVGSAWAERKEGAWWSSREGEKGRRSRLSRDLREYKGK